MHHVRCRGKLWPTAICMCLERSRRFPSCSAKQQYMNGVFYYAVHSQLCIVAVGPYHWCFWEGSDALAAVTCVGNFARRCGIVLRRTFTGLRTRELPSWWSEAELLKQCTHCADVQHSDTQSLCARPHPRTASEAGAT